MKKIVLFASGSGSNAENIIRHFKNSTLAQVEAVFCNNPNAGVIQRAEHYNVPVVVFSKDEWLDVVLPKLLSINPDILVLAGFLLKIPSVVVARFPDKIINIHPALLPKYGGKGMYGINVHRAVLQNQEIESGISIHYVNDHYDEGDVVFTKAVSISDCTSAEEIASKVQALEHEFFPVIIEQLLKTN